MDVTAVCERSDGWWAVTVPEVKGGRTQARRLDQVPKMVTDLVSLATGVPEDAVNVTVRVEESSLAHALDDWEQAGRLEREARDLQRRAAKRARDAVDELRAAGLSVRDVGTLLEVSPQRVSQLVKQ